MISDKEKPPSPITRWATRWSAPALEHTDPVHKVTIVSRGHGTGLDDEPPHRGSSTWSARRSFVDQLAQILGGRCAEDLILGEDNITTGASDDIRKATNLARKMVTEWGMSDKLGTPHLRGAPGDGLPRAATSASSATTPKDIASEIDQEVHQLVADAFQRAKKVLREREVVLRALAARLVEVETMDAPEMDRIIKEAELPNGVASSNGSGPAPEAPPAPPDYVPPAEAAAGA